MATTTNYGWTTPDDSALVKDGASAIRTLGSSVDTTVKALSPGTTAGDIDYYTSSTAKSRIAIGSSGQVLTVSGGVPSWATATSGGITLISETTASAVSSLSLSSIPSTYKDLVLTWGGIYHSAASNSFGLRVNNDGNSNYCGGFGGYGGGGNQWTSGNEGGIFYGSPIAPFGQGCDGYSTNYASAAKGTVIIYDYASTSKYKRIDGNFAYASTSAGTAFLNFQFVYKSTSAITSIDVVRITGSGTFSNAANTSIRLYGVS